MSDTTWWWIALAVGLVVELIAVYLLQTFLKQLHRIQHGAEAIWHVGKQVAGNTANTWILDEIAGRLDDLGAEGAQHRAFLQGAAKGGPR